MKRTEISHWALWTCGILTFAAGASVGLAVGVWIGVGVC